MSVQFSDLACMVFGRWWCIEYGGCFYLEYKPTQYVIKYLKY
jgi:hypothetical protein